jgi:hypothetical protein
VRTDSAAFGALSFEAEGDVSFAMVSGRTERDEGSIYFDLDTACLLPDVPWSYAVHVRSRREDGFLSKINVRFYFGDGTWMHLKDITTEAGWKTFVNTDTISFTAEQLANGTPYIKVLGAEVGTTIELSKMRFERADPSFYQPPTSEACAELVMNGDFSMDDDFIWPWRYRQGQAHKLWRTPSGKNRLALWGRTSTASGVAEQTIDASCLVPGTAYEVSAQALLASSSPCYAPGSDRSACARIVLKTMTHGGLIRETVVATQTTFNGGKFDFNTVAGSFTLPDHVGDADVETAWISLEADDGGASDVMRWSSISITRTAEPAPAPGGGADGALVDTLVLPRSIEPCWAPGAELLVTSWTSNVNDAQTAKILSVDYHSRDRIAVTLDAQIRRPTTVADSADFGIEVALLDRNVVLAGASDTLDAGLIGGHLIIMHTPGVAQLVRGVRLSKMGQQVSSARAGADSDRLVARNQHALRSLRAPRPLSLSARSSVCRARLDGTRCISITAVMHPGQSSRAT